MIHPQPVRATNIPAIRPLVVDEHAGHDRHAGHSVAMFRDRFWITLRLTVPTVVWSDMVQSWFGFTAPVFLIRVYSSGLWDSGLLLWRLALPRWRRP